jgi:hypothetical protein
MRIIFHYKIFTKITLSTVFLIYFIKTNFFKKLVLKKHFRIKHYTTYNSNDLQDNLDTCNHYWFIIQFIET